MIGTRIAELRKMKRMSQAQLAEKLHVSASSIGMYEQGRRTPSLDILILMSRVLETSIDYIVTGKEYSEKRKLHLGEYILLDDEDTSNYVVLILRR